MRPDPLRTNRDLYLFITGLRDPAAGARRELEEYLRALWRLGLGHRSTEQLSLECFAGLLATSFTQEAPAFDPTWRNRADVRARSDFERWERAILLQIVDLREMADAGMLADKLRYFGIDAPRGGRWYNFEPLTYLECAAAGTLGGWREGDDTGRGVVPGKVATLDDRGGIVPLDPHAVDDSIYDIPQVGWEMFTDFLNAGQSYE